MTPDVLEYSLTLRPPQFNDGARTLYYNRKMDSKCRLFSVREKTVNKYNKQMLQTNTNVVYGFLPLSGNRRSPGIMQGIRNYYADKWYMHKPESLYLFQFKMGVVQFKMGIVHFKMGVVLFKIGIVQFKMEKLL